jgi:hypothetical protein
VRQLQRVFAHLALTQRPIVDQVLLKTIIKDPFNGNKQQWENEVDTRAQSQNEYVRLRD